MIPETLKRDINTLIKNNDMQGLTYYLLNCAREETEYRESLFRYALERVKQ